MRRALWWRSVLLAMCWILPALPAESGGLELRLAYQDNENEPYQLGQGTQIDAHKPGLAVDLIRLSVLKAGLKPVFKRMPWKRVLEDLRSGHVDAAFGASFNAERAEFAQYPMGRDGQVDPARRAYRNAYRLYARIASQPQWDGKQLTGLSAPVGATRGYSVVAELRALGVPVDEGLSLNGDFRKLMLGHIGAVAALEPAADAWLRRHPEAAKEIVKLSPAVSTKDYYLILSKPFVAAQPQTADALWKALAEVREGPEMERLLERYLD